MLRQNDIFILEDGQETAVVWERRFEDSVLLRVTYWSPGRINNRTFRFWRCGPECDHRHRAEVQ